MLRRQSIGQEGASAAFCDLSGRGLSTSQVERSLRVFDTAVAIDMSNNELEQIPSTIPRDLLALDVSFNLLAHAHGLERLTMLQELHLGYNRLCDVSILEYCPLLQRVNLSGNRLANTRGLEALAHLVSLDLSDNLIEYPEALRALSLNRSLTHLTIRGNPIAHKAAIDCRIVVLDMIPSVLILDDKKIRATTKCKQTDTAPSAAATKSLSYSRIYDDKKQFLIRNQQTQRTPATRPAPILLGDLTVQPKYEGNTIFIQSPKATTVTQDFSGPYSKTEKAAIPLGGLSPAQLNSASHHLASSTTSVAPPGAPYMSLYDRLAAANGITKKPSHSEMLVDTQAASNTRTPKQILSTQPQCQHRDSGSSSKAKPSQMAVQRRPTETRPPSRGNTLSRPQTPAMQTNASTRSPQPFTNSCRQAALAPRPPSPPPAPTLHSTQYLSSTASSPVPQSYSSPAIPSLDPKQQNVLSVIQNLIQHKKQTLATLARQSLTNNTTSVYSS